MSIPELFRVRVRFLYTYIHTYIHTYMGDGLVECMGAVWIYVCIFMHTYIHACPCIHMYTHACTYIHIYIHTQAHTR